MARFDKVDPKNSINRRISLIVMTKEAEDESLKMDLLVPSAEAQAAPEQDATTTAEIVPMAAL